MALFSEILILQTGSKIRFFCIEKTKRRFRSSRDSSQKYHLKRFFRLLVMNLDAVKKKYWKKGVRKTKPGLLQETLEAQRAVKLGDFFGGVSGAAITVGYNKITKKMATGSPC